MEKSHISCQLCPENGVVSCNNGIILCLLHYYLTYSDDDSSNHYQIISDIGYNEQIDGVESLWKEAISEVILRMFELEKIDQQQLNDDPLSILSLNAPRLAFNSSKLTTTSEKKQKKQRIDSHDGTSSTSSTIVKPPSSASVSTTITATTTADDSIPPTSSSLSSSSSLPIIKERNQNHIQGSRCINCHSVNTYLEYGNNNWFASGRDVNSTKVETWAFKDSPSAITDNDYTFVKNICYDCGYETVE